MLNLKSALLYAMERSSFMCVCVCVYMYMYDFIPLQCGPLKEVRLVKNRNGKSKKALPTYRVPV